MFDIGFWELAMIMLVALVVIGPERLPGIARRVGLYVGKAQRMLATVKEEVNREIAAEELKKTLARQSGTDGGEFDFIADAKKELQDFQSSLNERIESDPPRRSPPSRSKSDEDTRRIGGTDTPPAKVAEDAAATTRSADRT
ncbi:MAG: twin-arginine translocase subunit TatB [Gammaproteobacteria bacterium]|nr:twin-arginine translocase subunit TatB [Gammaproteobacteria bacterium]MCP5136187.1 twin-arginine translocase subunit TatB [Gammaproteobacteria bacterium]